MLVREWTGEWRWNVNRTMFMSICSIICGVWYDCFERITLTDFKWVKICFLRSTAGDCVFTFVLLMISYVRFDNRGMFLQQSLFKYKWSWIEMLISMATKVKRYMDRIERCLVKLFWWHISQALLVLDLKTSHSAWKIWKENGDVEVCYFFLASFLAVN
jgi:hypothetical protein